MVDGGSPGKQAEQARPLFERHAHMNAPAFPVVGRFGPIYGGMTMREHIAIQAMTAIVGDAHLFESLATAAGCDPDGARELVAQWSVRLADALLTALDKIDPAQAAGSTPDSGLQTPDQGKESP